MGGADEEVKQQTIKLFRDMIIMAGFVVVMYYPEVVPVQVRGYILYVNDFIWEVNDFLVSLPNEVYYIVSVIAILWAGIGYDSPHDNWPIPEGGPLSVFSSIVSSVFLTHTLITPKISVLPVIVEPVFSGVVGIFVCLVCITVLQAIVMSICGVDITEEQNKRVDDPYGDKHAARILNEDENN
jgi:hypothetical protein